MYNYFIQKNDYATKKDIEYGTWNVFNRKMKEIIQENKKIEIDIITLTETKETGNVTEIVNENLHLLSGVADSQRAKRGGSIVIHY